MLFPVFSILAFLLIAVPVKADIVDRGDVNFGDADQWCKTIHGGRSFVSELYLDRAVAICTIPSGSENNSGWEIGSGGINVNGGNTNLNYNVQQTIDLTTICKFKFKGWYFEGVKDTWYDWQSQRCVSDAQPVMTVATLTIQVREEAHLSNHCY